MKRCVEICPLPQSDTVQTDRNKPSSKSLRRRAFEGGPRGTHFTSIVVPESQENGISVDPDEPACDEMVKLWEFGKNAQNEGGGLVGTPCCRHATETYWGTGNS